MGTAAQVPGRMALVDGARLGPDRSLPTDGNAGIVSLYKGRSEEILADVAPYLCEAASKTEFGRWLRSEGWGDAWAVFLDSAAPSEELHKHFRKFLLVQDEDGRELYFRFYDPRVLRIFLPTCTTDQLKEFFGPVQRFIVEDADPSRALVFSLDGGGNLRTEIVPLGTAVPPAPGTPGPPPPSPPTVNDDNAIV